MKNILISAKKYFRKNKLETVFLLLVITIAVFLRFYKIFDLHYFTYDQARDNLIAKRILIDRKLTLLGPQSSIGGVYCPPFYYYTIAIPLWLSGLNPVGVDIYTAFVGVMTVILIYFVANSFFGKPAGLFASSLYATSPLVVELSRHAWNPNTLPFFSLLTLFLGVKFWQNNKPKYLISMSLVYGYALSLHYSAFCLFPAIIYLWVNYYLKNRKILPLAVSFLTIAGFFLPLALFEIRHDFSLSKNIFTYLIKKGDYYFDKNSPSFLESIAVSAYEVIVTPLSGYFLKGVQGSTVPYEFAGSAREAIVKFAPVSIIAHRPLILKYYWWGIMIFFSLLVFSFYLWRRHLNKDRILFFIWFWFLGAIIVSRLYRGTLYFFYYLFLYPIPFLLWACLLSRLFKKKVWRQIIVIIVLFLTSLINLKQSLIYEVTGRTIDDIKAVAQIISKDVNNQSFNLATSYRDPDRWDHHGLDYRYFVEAYYKKKPLDWYPENYRESEILYFISEGKIENPLSSKIMEIEEFKPKIIIKSWNHKNEIFIYKLAKK